MGDPLDRALTVVGGVGVVGPFVGLLFGAPLHGSTDAADGSATRSVGRAGPAPAVPSGTHQYGVSVRPTARPTTTSVVPTDCG